MDTIQQTSRPTTQTMIQQTMDQGNEQPASFDTLARVATPALQQDDIKDGADEDLLDMEDTHGQIVDDQDEERDLEDYVGDGQTKYELRPAARELKHTFSRTWIDDDKTGLYDPVAEQRKLRQRPKRKNYPLKAFTPWDMNESDEECEPRKERAPKEGPSLGVTLSFKSEAGRAAYENHVRSLPADLEPSEELYCERRLRRRDSGVDFSHSLRGRTSRKKSLPDGLPEDLTGHPVARGCWQCLTIGIRCPLLDDERAWPCSTCLDDDDQCELITPPTHKRACEHCKSRRFGCSYTHSLDHDEPCEECSRNGWRCVAGPAKESIRERISYDRDWENDPWQAPKAPKVKKLPSCRRCRERNQPCSFSAGDKSDVCTACDMASVACLPEMETSQSSRKRKKAPTNSTNANNGDKEEKSWGPDVFGSTTENQRAIVIESGSSDDDSDFQIAPMHARVTRPMTLKNGIDSSDDEFEAKRPPKRSKTNTKTKISAKGKKDEGTMQTICTKFAHPIQFNFEGSEPCHFCSDIRFAMFGLGAKEVEVVVWNDGRGLEEISGGHRGEGIESTRMCVACTTQRLSVVMCVKHELRELEGESVTLLTPVGIRLTNS